ncbi:MAG: hypothetical protein CR217_17155 [Beijerinckiaceae bacterium]|nr:MAG: hypothetical protein CR217_17155 [Beijerinckiaceae bacterium]
MNNIGIGDQAIEAVRLGGIGWIFAFFVVGATILGGRWLLGWQMRRLERKFPGYLKSGDPPGSGKSDGDTGETPRG